MIVADLEAAQVLLEIRSLHAAQGIEESSRCNRLVSLEFTHTRVLWRVRPAGVADMWIAEAGNHRLVLQQLGGGLWRMHIAGPDTADFQNLYSSTDKAKADAALFVEVQFHAWQIPIPEELQWIEA